MSISYITIISNLQSLLFSTLGVTNLNSGIFPEGLYRSNIGNSNSSKY